MPEFAQLNVPGPHQKRFQSLRTCHVIVDCLLSHPLLLPRRRTLGTLVASVAKREEKVKCTSVNPAYLLGLSIGWVYGFIWFPARCIAKWIDKLTHSAISKGLSIGHIKGELHLLLGAAHVMVELPQSPLLRSPFVTCKIAIRNPANIRVMKPIEVVGGRCDGSVTWMTNPAGKQ